jgi:hypothetical protein
MSYLYMGAIVPISIAIPITVGVAKYKRLDQSLKIVFLFLVVNGLTNVIAKLLAVAQVTNLPALHVYTVIELWILLLFYRSILNDIGLSRFIPIIIIAFFVVSVINTLFFQSIFTYNSYTRSLEAILIILFAIIYFIKRLDKVEQSAKGTAIAIINSALLFYFSGALILFIVSNVIVTDIKLGAAIWNVHATLVLLMYILFAVALYIYKP